MRSRIDSYDKLVLRRQSDIEDLQRAVQLVNRHFASLPPGTSLPARVLTTALHQRTNSLKRVIRRNVTCG